MLLHESLAPESFVPKVNLPSVLGVTDQKSTNHVSISLPSQVDVQNKIKDIQQQVTHLNVNDVASSSPQVQQILKQLQQIPAGPVGQVKEACMRLCSQL
jgi:hypothetical protein